MLGGCVSSPEGDDIERNNTTRNIIAIDKTTQTQLTYRLRGGLIADERNAFMQYLGTDSAVKDLSPALNEAIGATGAFSKAAFMYTREWNDAYLSGNLTETLGLMAAAGATFALITPSKERNRASFDYYFYEKDAQSHSVAMVTSRKRKESIEAIYSFGELQGYEVTCAKGCTSDNTPIIGETNEFHLQKIPSASNTFYKPNFIRISTQLSELTFVEKAIDAPLLGQPYNFMAAPYRGWAIDIRIPRKNRAPTITKLENNELSAVFEEGRVVGTSIHKALYTHLTKNIKGLSRFKNDFHNHLAFYDGKVYQLHEELIDNSIIKGEIIN
jgi:hypothetical protein